MYEYKPGTWWCGSRSMDQVCMTEDPHVWLNSEVVLMSNGDGEIALAAAELFTKEWNGDSHLTKEEAHWHTLEAARAILTVMAKVKHA